MAYTLSFASLDLTLGVGNRPLGTAWQATGGVVDGRVVAALFLEVGSVWPSLHDFSFAACTSCVEGLLLHMTPFNGFASATGCCSGVACASEMSVCGKEQEGLVTPSLATSFYTPWFFLPFWPEVLFLQATASIETRMYHSPTFFLARVLGTGTSCVAQAGLKLPMLWLRVMHYHPCLRRDFQHLPLPCWYLEFSWRFGFQTNSVDPLTVPMSMALMGRWRNLYFHHLQETFIFQDFLDTLPFSARVSLRVKCKAPSRNRSRDNWQEDVLF